MGLGKQRYIFKNEGEKLTRSNQHSPILSRDAIGHLSEALLASGPTHTPCNSLTRLTSAFAKKIDSTVDIRVQLPWNFGPFLEEVPRRLGTNEALDAASDALITAYTGFCAGEVAPSPEVLGKHSRALNSLRRCLDDPVKAHSSETLCAIMMLLIHQVRGMTNTWR